MNPTVSAINDQPAAPVCPARADSIPLLTADDNRPRGTPLTAPAYSPVSAEYSSCLPH